MFKAILFLIAIVILAIVIPKPSLKKETVNSAYPVGMCYVENTESHKVIVFDSTGKVLCLYYHDQDSCKK